MKAQDAATIIIMASGLKLTPSICDIDSATGNIKAAVAVLLIMLVIRIVSRKTTPSAILGLLPPRTVHNFATVSERPLAVTADSKPKATPRTTRVSVHLVDSTGLDRGPLGEVAVQQ